MNMETIIDQTSEPTYKKSSRKRRIVAFMIDHVILMLLMMIVLFVGIGPDFKTDGDFDETALMLFVSMMLAFLLFFAKDSFGGVSFGRWVMGIMVRKENNPEEVPSFGRMFGRNVLTILWPLEFLILITNDEKKRLGDKIAKTIVIKNPNKPKRLKRILPLLLIVIGFISLMFIYVNDTINNSEPYKLAIKAIEKNEKILKETGDIKDYGFLPSTNIKIHNGYGSAIFIIDVIGEKKDLKVTVYLEKKPFDEWEVMEIRI